MLISDSALLLRDFVNSLDVDLDADEIDTPARLRDWLARRGLLTAAQPVTSADVRLALSLREGLRDAMDGTANDALDHALGSLPLRATCDDGPTLVPCAAGVAGALAAVAAALATARVEGSWSRLKVCRGCRWAFVDTSKNRSRSWCSMRVCGNRSKTRAYRARRRT